MGKRRGDEFSGEDEAAEDRQRRKERRLQHYEEEESDEEVEDYEDSKAEPIGGVLKVSGDGKNKKNHYGSFEVEGNIFELEDSVLLTPEESKLKPHIAIIKDITEDVDGNLMVTGQWFYRPEEAERKGGGNWQASDTRELFFSFHRDDFPAESVMHKCVVHFVPLHKKLPIRSQHPGFIVQKVYDAAERKLWKLTDKDYEDGKQHEIDMLVQKTREHLGELPDLEPEESLGDQSNQTAQASSKCKLRRENVPYTDAQRADGASTRFDSATNTETPSSCGDLSEYDAVLKKFNALTTDSHRDKWLKRLLQAIQTTCKDLSAHQNAGGSIHGSSNAAEKVYWPNAAVSAITALEKASHELLGFDFQKYNQKLRQLAYNLKNKLAECLLNEELEPSVVLTMTPDELRMASAGAGDEPPRRSISSLFRVKKALSRRRSTTPTATSTPDSQPARELTDQQIPDEPSPGTVESATVESTRAYIEPEGNTFNPHDPATHKITSLIRSSFESPYLNWTAIPIEVRDMWFREFERSFHWLPQYNARIRRNFEKAGSKNMRDMFTDIRAAGEQPDWIGDRVWAELGKKWMSPEYVAMCAQNKKNRASDCGGMGTSKSTCGSRPLTQHRRHLAAELGREPTLPELHMRTHTKKGTQDWIDNRAKAVHDNYLRLKEQHSQPNVGDRSSGASSQVPSDFSLWTQAVGGKNRGRTYGLGSQGPAIDAQNFYASPSDFSGRTIFDFQHHMVAMQAQHQQEMAAMQAQHNEAMKKQQDDLFRQMEERMTQRFGQSSQQPAS